MQAPRPKRIDLYAFSLGSWLFQCARFARFITSTSARSFGSSEANFDAFIVDFRLAGAVNGIEATRLLRAKAGQAVPAILVTGDTDPARVRSAYESGLVVLFKPVQPDHLLQTLHAVLHEGRTQI